MQMSLMLLRKCDDSVLLFYEPAEIFTHLLNCIWRQCTTTVTCLLVKISLMLQIFTCI